jgi:hypothetical protein
VNGGHEYNVIINLLPMVLELKTGLLNSSGLVQTYLLSWYIHLSCDVNISLKYEVWNINIDILKYYVHDIYDQMPSIYQT